MSSDTGVMDVPLDVRRQGPVLVLTMHDPATKNALQPGVYEGGLTALDQVKADPSVRAVILTGADGAFCSGGDLRRISRGDIGGGRASIDAFHAFIQAMRTVPVPVIAAVEGPAAGAGFSMAAACDLIVAAEDARFVMAYVRVGLNPDGGASSLLSRGVPHQTVAEILFDGDVVPVARLHALGLVNRVVPSGTALEAALTWAERLAKGPRAALGRAKRLLEEARRNPLADHLDLEADLFLEATRHPEAREGMTAFLEKRAPDYSSY